MISPKEAKYNVGWTVNCGDGKSSRFSDKLPQNLICPNVSEVPTSASFEPPD